MAHLPFARAPDIIFGGHDWERGRPRPQTRPSRAVLFASLIRGLGRPRSQYALPVELRDCQAEE